MKLTTLPVSSVRMATAIVFNTTTNKVQYSSLSLRWLLLSSSFSFSKPKAYFMTRTAQTAATTASRLYRVKITLFVTEEQQER